MKIEPIAVNHIIIVTETGQRIDINDGGKMGLLVRSADFEGEIPVVEHDDTRVIISFRKREEKKKGAE